MATKSWFITTIIFIALGCARKDDDHSYVEKRFYYLKVSKKSFSESGLTLNTELWLRRFNCKPIKNGSGCENTKAPSEYTISDAAVGDLEPKISIFYWSSEDGPLHEAQGTANATILLPDFKPVEPAVPMYIAATIKGEKCTKIAYAVPVSGQTAVDIAKVGASIHKKAPWASSDCYSNSYENRQLAEEK